MKVHNVRYENGGFYLTIDNLRGYFKHVPLPTYLIYFSPKGYT